MRRFLLTVLLLWLAVPPTIQAAPSPFLLAQRQKAGPLTVDSHFVYWANEDGSVRRVSKRGGKVETLATGPYAPLALATDEAYLYWLDKAKMKLFKLPLKGGRPAPLADLHNEPQALVVDHQAVYWTERAPFAGRAGNEGIADPRGRLLKVLKKGSIPVVLAGGQQGPGALAQDAANLYWIAGGSRAVLRLAKSAAPDTQPESLFQGSPGWGITVDDKAIYFTDNGSDRVRRIDKTSRATIDLAKGLRFPDNIGQDASYVYFTSGGGGGLQRVAKAGGPLTVVNPHQYGPFQVDEHFIYWAEKDRILRRSK